MYELGASHVSRCPVYHLGEYRAILKHSIPSFFNAEILPKYDVNTFMLQNYSKLFIFQTLLSKKCVFSSFFALFDAFFAFFGHFFV